MSSVFLPTTDPAKVDHLKNCEDPWCEYCEELGESYDMCDNCGEFFHDATGELTIADSGHTLCKECFTP